MRNEKTGFVLATGNRDDHWTAVLLRSEVAGEQLGVAIIANSQAKRIGRVWRWRSYYKKRISAGRWNSVDGNVLDPMICGASIVPPRLS